MLQGRFAGANTSAKDSMITCTCLLHRAAPEFHIFDAHMTDPEQRWHISSAFALIWAHRIAVDGSTSNCTTQHAAVGSHFSRSRRWPVEWHDSCVSSCFGRNSDGGTDRAASRCVRCLKRTDRTRKDRFERVATGLFIRLALGWARAVGVHAECSALLTAAVYGRSLGPRSGRHGRDLGDRVTSIDEGLSSSRRCLPPVA